MILRSWWFGWLYLMLLAFGITGCTLLDSPDSTPGSGPGGAPDTLRDDFQARLVEIQQAHQAAQSLWDRLIFGEAVACTESLPVPPPLDFPANTLQRHPLAAPIQAELNAAVGALGKAAELWDNECGSDLPQVPLSVAQAARIALVTAAAAQDQAQTHLAAWPE